MRFHLLKPNGALWSPETYNKFFTMHGVVMVWFSSWFPLFPPRSAIFWYRMMIGARDLAFPRLNLLSW